jgi:predicted DCC family thiol-disulfide oxidoreductase YuxK
MTQQAAYEIEVYFDGACPLCVKEMNLLRSWDADRKIRFTDIAAAEFDPPQIGRTFDELMARMHGRLPDGAWIEGVEVFRRLYSAVGFRRLAWFSRLPLLSQCLDVAYAIFARNRLRMTGRCTTAACAVPSRSTPPCA